MTHTRRESPAIRILTGIRLLFAAIGLLGLIFGFLGLEQYMHAAQRPTGDASFSNLIYYDIELTLLQSTPLASGGPVSALLQVGRFCAPCVLVYPVVEVSVAFLAARFRRARMRRARGHAIVCGSSRAARVLTTRLRANGTRVIVVSTDPVDESERDTVAGDPRRPQTLLAAGIGRAHRLYACLDLGEQNAEIAAAVERVALSDAMPERVRILIPDLDLCFALRARHWSVASPAVRRLGFFNPEESAAQATVRADDAAFAGRPPQIGIVGTGAFARSVLVEFARQWVVRGEARRGPFRALLIGDDAPAVASALSGQYAFLADACRIEPRAESFEKVLEWYRADPSTPRLRRLYLCQENEAEALKAALDTVAHFQSIFTEVVVRLDRMTGIAAGFRPGWDNGTVLFEALGGRLRLVDVNAEGCDPDVVDDDLAESLARACHQRYLSDQFASGASSNSSPSLIAWEGLADEYRAANREQAADIGRKLAAIGCVLSTRRTGGPQFAFRDDEVERLAELEHERWTDERLYRGWAWGRIRDDAARLHPALIPWRTLPEPQREKDREVVRGLPEMLADAGLAIVRLIPGQAEHRDKVPGLSAANGLTLDASPLPARSP